MTISQKEWNNYIQRLRKLSDKAAEEFSEYAISHLGYAHIERDELIKVAHAIATKYGEGTAALSAEMYDAIAEASGKVLPAAIPAETATYSEVAKTINGIRKFSQNENLLSSAVGNLVKRAGVDTTIKNAIRDGAEWAWIPHGDTCAFCLTLASQGWQKASKAVMKGDHAEHIHQNCDCTFAVRFDKKSEVEGYVPEVYKRIYDNAGGLNSKDKINALRRVQYKKKKQIINAQKREAYALRTLSKTESTILDITEEFLSNATPKKGEFDIVTGFKEKNGEEKAAKWLHDTFGGDIKLLPENNPEGQSNPDYLWNGKLWDLKSPESLNGVSKRLKHGLEQINSNPGGIVIDIKGVEDDLSEIERVINNRLRVSAKSDVDVIVLNNNRLVKVIRHKK